MTYSDLLCLLQNMSFEQLNSTITVELGVSDECYPAEMRIADIEHDVLDENHPVIFVKEA